MHVRPCLCSVAACVLPFAPAGAAEAPQADPAVYVKAFDDTCRRGFPDMDAIAAQASAQGWSERPIRVIAGGEALASGLPRILGKDGLMLFISQPGQGRFRTVCQVTGTAPTRLSGRDVAVALAPTLHAAQAVPGPGDYKKDDYALWTIEPGVTVQAGISVQRAMRTISIAIRQAGDGAPFVGAPSKKPSGDIPMVAIGLPFAPDGPVPVGSTHPLFHDVAVGEIEGLPATVKSSPLNFIAAAKRSSINDALRETLGRMNLLAPSAAAPRKKLLVTWKGDRTPFHVGTSNSTSVTLHYRLVRVDSDQLLFERDITTTASGGGADASMRDNGIVRAAIGTNFASAARCLDRAAFGEAPTDCALVPKFSVSITRVSR